MAQDKLKENVTQAVKDAVKLHVESYLVAMTDGGLESVEFHPVTEQVICVRVKEKPNQMSRHFEVRVSESL